MSTKCRRSRTMVSMKHFLVASALLLGHATIVQGQSANCVAAQQIATDLAKSEKCGCTAPPSCLTCGELDGRLALTACDNGCEHCLKGSVPLVCGSFRFSVGRETTLQNVVVLTANYSWAYTKGRTGSVSFRRTSDGACSAILNDKACKSCSIDTCGAGSLPEPRIDCSNVEAGATATPCTNRTAGGIVSLTATEQNSGLAPLAFPYWGCVQNTTVLGIKSPMAAPASPPTGGPPISAPAAAPVGSPSSPTATPASDRCGLFGLGIFCFRGCGLIRRILGLCGGD